MAISSFSHMKQVDDVFCKQLLDSGEPREGLFGFSEVTEGMPPDVSQPFFPF